MPKRKRSVRVKMAAVWAPAPRDRPRALARAAEVAIADVMKVRRDERVVIVTNPEHDVFLISQALYEAAAAAGAQPVVIVQPRKTSLDVAADEVIHALHAEPEVIISISAAKLGKDRFGLAQAYTFPGVKGKWSHLFDALMGAKRSRAFWSPSVTLDTFIRTVPVDYALMRRRARALKRLLDGAERVHITAPGGTDAEIGLRGRKAHLDDGSFNKPGTGGNLPAGEAYISPTKYDAEGVLVFDGSLSVVQGGAIVPARPVTVEVRKGRAVKVRGGAGAKTLEESLRAGEEMARRMEGKPGWTKKRVRSYEHHARHLGELGIGLNPAARVTGNMLEDEKILGTCHLAIGANYDQDAEAFIHLDCIIKSPTIMAIGPTGRRREIMRRGAVLA